MPVPVVHFKDHANDIAMRNHAYKAGTAVYQSLGATQVFELPPFPSTHNMGTCRQSEKAQDGVCNKYGQTHDVAESVHLGRQPVHHRRRRESDADHRCARDPASRISG